MRALAMPRRRMRAPSGFSHRGVAARAAHAALIMLAAVGTLVAAAKCTGRSDPPPPSLDAAPAEPPADGSSRGQTPGRRPALTRELAVETFDAVWRRVDETDFEIDHGGVDWIAVRDELRPLAEEATSAEELRRILRSMLARLGRSHFAVIPGERADRRTAGVATLEPDGTADRTGVRTDGHAVPPAEDLLDGDGDDVAADATFGLSLRLVEGGVTVADVAGGSAAAEAGIARGWRLRRIDGRDVDALIRTGEASSPSLSRYLLEGAARRLDRGPRTRHELLFTDLDGVERSFSLRRRPSTATLVKSGPLPPMPFLVESGWVEGEVLDRAGAAGRRVAFIRFSAWLPEAAPLIDRAVDELRGAEGFIVDIRGNPGGYGGMAMGIGGHFVRDPVSIGTMITREGPMEFRLNPRRATVDGRIVEPVSAPLAILIDPLSASTSEIFAGGMQDIGRARIFGEPSAGAALPAQMFRLPNGDVLLHAIADFRVPSGASLEGRGVVPDEPRTLTRRDLATSGDPVLVDAVRWIRDAAAAVR